jgi:hypothetical protein
MSNPGHYPWATARQDLTLCSSEFEKKMLGKPRTALFGGTSIVIRDMKKEIGLWMQEKFRAIHTPGPLLEKSENMHSIRVLE